ncbi:MAG: Pvc16 family protein [bacterium]
MSYLAIGAVTKAIVTLLEKKLNKPPLMGATATFRVTTLPPDDDRIDDADGVNLFLYRVTESPFAKNMDWRGDRANPVGTKRPPLALTLHYLLTAYAKKSNATFQDDITAHQVLGNAMAIMHEHPVINDIHDSDFDASVDTQFAKELRDSFEKIKVTMAPISMDDFSKIWTGFSKAYRLSVAYEASLAQIAPIVPAKMPAPPVQQTSLQVTTLSPPVIASITPATGSAGAPVSIKGRNFKAKGFSTAVVVGETTFSESELTQLTPDEIVLNIPEAPQRGPRLPVIVSLSGRESAPVFYEVKPWIDLIQPVRGITGIPLAIPFEIPSGATIGVEIGGVAATVTLDPINKVIHAIVPAIDNGRKTVVVTVNGQRSNTRFYEVLPAITLVTVESSSAPAPPKTQITVLGERLDGTEVHVKYGVLLIKKSANGSATQVTVEIDRHLPAHQAVSVIVDGLESNPITA